ncbi:MAG TPA: diaminopimelate decarboxylase [Caulobacteraceae bacterium]|jgi:diaminopimelate decarboxylase
MNFFEVKGGELWCEDVPLRKIADEVGTPVYVYSTATLERHYTVFRDAFATRKVLVAYAMKANSNLSVLKTLARLGAGADTVSEGEIRRALAAGVQPSRIVFSGVGKSRRELAFAVEVGVSEINIESEPELDTLIEVAELLDARPKITFRVNPDVAAGGHAKISTGKSENKFGVSFSEAERLYAKAVESPHVDPIGVACHIGSQIDDLGPMAQAFEKMRGLVERLRGRGLKVERLDLGGGLGAPYFNQPDPPSPADFAAMVEEVLEGLDIELVFEPGRVIAANAGILLSRVIHVHERPEGRRFLVVDGAMNDLVRPAMYDAFHDIRPVSSPRRGANLLTYDVVGPICETGDTFCRERALPPLGAGDLVVFMTAGAYGATMSSEYNTRPLVPEVLVAGDQYAVVRPRPTYEEMLAREPLAPWL